MISLLEKRPILTIIAVVGLMLLPFLDVLEVTIMEARNFITAREMLVDGNWILTTMNGEPRYEKPPLTSWITALSASVFGIKSVWGMRFPAVLMVMLLGSVIYMLSRKCDLSKRQSLINGLISVTSLYVVLIIFEAPWDIYTHAFMLTAIYLLFEGLQSRQLRGRLYHWIAGGFCIGASVLSKGPVSLYVLFLPFLISYLIIYRKGTSRKQWLPFVITLLCGLVLGFSWYAYVRYADPETFMRITLNETGNWSSYNVRPFYYYWSFFIQSGLWTIPAFVSLLYPYMKTRVSSLKVYRFTLLWVVLSVILLSVIPEKKSRYLMPVLIPLAMNIGFYIEYLVRRFKDLKDWRETVPVYFNFGLIGVALLVLGASLMLLGWSTDHFFTVYAMPCILIVVSSLLVVYFLKQKEIYKCLLITILSLVISVNLVLKVQKEVGALLSNTQDIDKEVQKEDPKETVLTSFNDFTAYPSYPIFGLNDSTPEMIWAYGKKIPRIVDNTKIKMSPKEDTFYVLEFYDEPSIVVSTFPKANVTYKFTLDLNTVSNKCRDYKTRKVARVFLIEK